MEEEQKQVEKKQNEKVIVKQVAHSPLSSPPQPPTPRILLKDKQAKQEEQVN